MTRISSDAAFRFNCVCAGDGQFYLVASVAAGADCERTSESIYRMVAEQLALHEAEIVHERVFGTLSLAPTVLAARARSLLPLACAPVPPTYFEGAPTWGPGLAGVTIQAVAPRCTVSGIETLYDDTRPVGRRWNCNDVEQLSLQGLIGAAFGPRGSSVNFELELQGLFDRMQRLLTANDATFADVIRTWFYVDGILPIYAAFNRVRNTRYAASGLSSDSQGTLALPASTGIGGKHWGQGRVLVDVLVTPRAPQGAVQRLASLTQQDPSHYGSSFARATLMRAHESTTIQLSGTAAIGEAGESLHLNDVAKQIDATLAHITALLKTTGAQLTDIASATMFLKQPQHADVLSERLRSHGLDELPAVVVVADVCRDELLFELDAEIVYG